MREQIDLGALASAASSNPAFRALLDEFLRQYGHLLRIDGDPSVELGMPSEIPLARDGDSSEFTQESVTDLSEISSGEAPTIFSKRGICDPAFESLVGMLVEHYRNGLSPEDSGNEPADGEPPTLLSIPSLSPVAAQEDLTSEGGNGSKARNLKSLLLTILVVGLAICLGVLLGMHRMRSEGTARTYQRAGEEAPPMATPQPVHHSEIDRGQPNRILTTSANPLRDTYRKRASGYGSDGGLTVFQNDKVIFQLSPKSETPANAKQAR